MILFENHNTDNHICTFGFVLLLFLQILVSFKFQIDLRKCIMVKGKINYSPDSYNREFSW